MHVRGDEHAVADSFMEQVAQLCREQRARAKWVLVPTPRLRWTLGERLLQEGCDWVNLRFTTPIRLALRPRFTS